MTESDSEISAMGAIAGIMEGLPEEQRGRVIRYIVERFSILGIAKGPNAPSSSSQVAPPNAQPVDFEDFASLVDRAGPNTDTTRALIAGYWLQVCKGGPSFDAQAANSELKHLGHAASNITSALTALISQKPALVLQLRKSGSTKQARKSYKLTEAGIRKVKEMMSSSGDSE